MKEKDGSSITFLILISVFFLSILSAMAYSQSEPIVFKFDFPEPLIVQGPIYDNVTYDSIIMPGLRKYGKVGLPILPFKTVRVLIPQDSNLRNIEISTGREIALDGRYRIEYSQPQIPLGRVSCGSVIEKAEPNETVYSSTEPFPGKLYSRLPLQNCRGYKILILNLHPVQYVPKERLISYFADMTVKVNMKPTLEVNPLFRNLARDKAKIIKKVDNPDEINSYTKVSESSHTGCICDPADSYDYVIITNNNLKNSTDAYTFQDLINHKKGKGINATIVTVEEIMADADYACGGAYGDGCGSGDDFNDTQAHIRNFIKDAYLNWGTEYVLLGGDADRVSWPPESEDNIIPARNFYAFDVGGAPPDSQIPADLYYAALDGNWNNDGDDRWGEYPNEADFLAEVYIGRAPVDSNEELSNFVRKTIAYENSNDPYLKEACMVGEKLFDDANASCGGDFKDEIKDGSNKYGYTTAGFPDFYDVSTLYDRDYPNEPNGWPKSEVISIINNDVHLMNHLGHGSTLWIMKLCNAPVYEQCPFCGSSGDTDVDDLTNDKYCFIYSQAFYPGAFDNWDIASDCSPSEPDWLENDCIGEHFVTSAHGAFAVVMNSRTGRGQGVGTNGASQHYDREFWDAIFGENITHLGHANEDSKEDNVELIEDQYMRLCYYELNLLGDPETAIWTGDKFRIKNDSGRTVAWFDGSGDLVLKGTLDANTTPEPNDTIDEFRFQDPNGSDLAIIDANSGNMYITGLLYENQDTLQLDGDNHFIIKDGNDTAVAYIDDPNGSLYLKGQLYQNSNP